MEKKETPQRNLRRFFVVGREPEKVTFRFAERNASFNFSGTFRFADYMCLRFGHEEPKIVFQKILDNVGHSPCVHGEHKADDPSWGVGGDVGWGCVGRCHLNKRFV